ncbi:hypothetical protein [Streptomyces sp. NPDC004658]|uniref:hypothetical protein n=1 Tax=Streptomyces sp. NPDC004658 TaxID=3154672 RepID=UPI0033A3CE60
MHPSCVAAVDTAPALPPADELVRAFTALWNVGGAGITLAEPDRVEPHNRALREAARAIDSWAYAEAVKETQKLSRRIVEGFLAGFDLLVTPTMACLPPLVGAWRAGTDDDPLRALRNSYPMGVFTSVFNVTRPPACPSASRSSPRHGGRTCCSRCPACWNRSIPGPIAAPASASS